MYIYLYIFVPQKMVCLLVQHRGVQQHKVGGLGGSFSLCLSVSPSQSALLASGGVLWIIERGRSNPLKLGHGVLSTF